MVAQTTDLGTGPVADLVRAGRFDEALAELWRQRERTPGDPVILQRIQAVRERMTTEALERLKPFDRVVARVQPAPRAALDGTGEKYVLDQCVDDTATID